MQSGIDIFAPGAAPLMILTAARTGGMVLIAPVFSARMIPMMLRTAIVVVLAVLMFPVARAASPGLVAITPASVIGETFVGFIIGLGAALLIGAAESAGELLGAQIGLSGAALLDPTSLQQSTALGQFMQLFALTLLLATNGHLVMLDALAATLRSFPVGNPISLTPGLHEAASLGTTLFALGLRFAAPVIAVVLIANVALAVLSRAAPQLNILQLAFPVQILVGLAVLLASLPFIASWFLGWEATYDGMLTRVFATFAGAGAR
jgi:flagellar biosynthetic protein FliR